MREINDLSKDEKRARHYEKNRQTECYQQTKCCNEFILIKLKIIQK